MNTQKIQITVGIFVFLGIVALTVLAVSMGAGRLSLPNNHVLTARFNNVNGLKHGSPVRIGGVTIGEVTKISLKPDDLAAMVTFKVEAEIKLGDDTVAAIRSSGLLGDKFIALKPGASTVLLKDGSTIVDTESTIDLEDLIARFAFGSTDKDKK